MVDAEKIMELWQEGMHYEELGDINGALEKYKQAIQIAPTTGYGTSLVWTSSAGAFRKAGMNDMAVECYKSAVLADDSNDSAYIELIQFLTDLEKYQEAIDYIDKYLVKFPNDDFAWSHKGVLLDILNRSSEARTCLKKAEELNPNNPQIVMLKEQGRL